MDWVAVSGGCLVAAAWAPLASAASMVEVTLEVTTATTATARLATPSHKVAVYPLTPRRVCSLSAVVCRVRVRAVAAPQLQRARVARAGELQRARGGDTVQVGNVEP